jgi:hypothetical protein
MKDLIRMKQLAGLITENQANEMMEMLDEGVGNTIKIVKSKSKYLKGDFSKFIGDEGNIIEYPYSDKTVNVKMITGIMKGSTMLFPTDIIQTK